MASGVSGGLIKPQSRKTQIYAQAKRQTRLLEQQNEILAQRQPEAEEATYDEVPAGYYHCETDPHDVERLWDGEQWTEVTRRASVRRAPKQR
jgi:hypothetical protein